MPDNYWDSEASKEHTVVHRVDAVAVYTNASGYIVIRQQDVMDAEQDQVICVPKASVSALIEALTREAQG